MTRKLKVLGLALTVALALGAVSAPSAFGASALFTAQVGAGETAKSDASQIGADSFTMNGLKVTCATFTLKGEALTAGPSSESVELTPTYETCHVVIAGLTKLLTVTTNGCTFRLDATKNTSGFAFGGDLSIVCPEGKYIETHIYNAAASESTTLCTWDVTPQSIKDQIQMTNEFATTPDEVIAHVNATVTLDNTIKNATCGQNAIEIGTYSGKDRVQMTNAAGVFVNGSVS